MAEGFDVDALLDSALTGKKPVPAPSQQPAPAAPVPPAAPAPASTAPAPATADTKAASKKRDAPSDSGSGSESDSKRKRKRSRTRSRSRSGHRSHHRSSHGHTRHSSSGRHKSSHRSHRSRSRSRRHERSRSGSRGAEVAKGADSAAATATEELDPREAERRQVERDSRTVFAFNLPLRAVERDLRTFFERAGRIADIRLITDRNSRRSKGVGYVEYEAVDSVPRALALSGQQLMGQTIMVQLTQAEKNRAAAAAAVAQPVVAGPARIHVGNLPKNISESDVRAIFSHFGEIESLSVPTDAEGAGRGYAVVQYRRNEEARKAIQHAHGVEVAGLPLKVSFALQDVAGAAVVQTVGSLPTIDDDVDGADGGIHLNAQGRALLMAKLQARGQPVVSPVPAVAPVLPLAVAPGLLQLPPQVAPAVIAATPCLLLKNMFDPALEMDPNFDDEIREDVAEECGKHGRVLHVFVDKASAGHVWLRFVDAASAQRAQSALNHRWFASKMITAEFIPEQVYSEKFPAAGRP